MQTLFTEQQLNIPAISDADQILRRCVHCGFCTATCPTYQLLGDELDSPRGRIYLIKDMLENNRSPTDKVVKHIDRCLSCLSCMTTCPADVNYMHLLAHGRHYIEKHYRRPLLDRSIRALLATTMPRPGLFKWIVRLSHISKAAHWLLPKRLKVIVDQAQTIKVKQNKLPEKSFTPKKNTIATVGLLAGCVQQTIDNNINQATIGLLTRLGYEVFILKDTSCCGAIEHHLGKATQTEKRIKDNVKNWTRLIDAQSLDKIIINASGCGTMVKDYAYLLRDDKSLSVEANLISVKAMDITEFVAQCDVNRLSFRPNNTLTVAYHNPCSMQHGQQIISQPIDLLEKFGFQVKIIPEGHMCCGSAGTYNLLQPELADQLGRRKADNINTVKADIVATGNLGCITQMETYLNLPIVHTVELLDWASGGNKPASLSRR